MALSNSTELRAAIADWLNRADLSNQIVDFIRLAEADFNRLRLREMVVRDDAFPIDAELIPLPTGYREMLSFQVAGSPTNSLIPVTAQKLAELRENQWAGPPFHYTINGTDIELYPVPSAGSTASLSYYQEIPPLASNATNWMLTKNPDMYLYNSLLKSAPFLKDDPRIQTWNSFYLQAKIDAGVESANSAHGPNMQMRLMRR